MEKDQVPMSLLLLPRYAGIVSSRDFQAAYGPSTEKALSLLSQSEEKRLDIALALPAPVSEAGEVSRAAQFRETQKALAQAYSLICTIAATRNIDLDWLGGNDIRVTLLVPSSKSTAASKNCSDDCFSGPLITLGTLVASGRRYETLYVVETADGEKIQQEFLELHSSRHGNSPTTRRVPCGVPGQGHSEQPKDDSVSNRIHHSVAVGGTFDHLHIGHKLLLSALALLAEPKGSLNNPSSTAHLTVGISGDNLLRNKKFAEEMESWDQRQNKVAEFLESILIFCPRLQSARKSEEHIIADQVGKSIRVSFEDHIVIDYVQIDDPFGPTITDENITALVVSQETRAGGKSVNDKRQEKDWPPLEIFEVDVLGAVSEDGDGQVLDSDPTGFSSKISSTDIRQRAHNERLAV